MFAAPVDFQFEAEALVFRQFRHSGLLDRGNMHEGIRLSVIAGNEAETALRIEEFDRAFIAFAVGDRRRALAEALATRSGTAVEAAFARWPRRSVRHFQNVADDLHIGGRHPAIAVGQGKFDFLFFGNIVQPSLFQRGNMQEHVIAAIIAGDEAEALLTVEEFYLAAGAADDDAGALPTTTAATKAATTTAHAAIRAAAKAAARSAAAIAATAAATATATAKAATIAARIEVGITTATMALATPPAAAIIVVVTHLIYRLSRFVDDPALAVLSVALSARQNHRHRPCLFIRGAHAGIGRAVPAKRPLCTLHAPNHS